MPTPLFAVVEIGDDPTMLLVAGVFVVTFVAVCAVAFFLLAKRRPTGGGPATTWKFEVQGRLPVSKETFERIADVTAAAVETPEVSEASRAYFDRLDQARGVFVSVYRILFITVGLAGLVGGVLLLRSHTPANMLGLPGGIVVLLSLGALLKGLVPGPSVMPIEPLGQGLVDQMREKIKVQVLTPEPLTVRLGEPEVRKAGEMLRQGAAIADVVRAVYPAYDGLSDFEKRAIESAIREATGK